MNAYIGHPGQLSGFHRFRFTEGAMDGLEAVEVYNETGLRFTVLLGRGMDIGSASYKGTNLSYLAASGITSAAYYQNGGKEWKHCFTGGLLYTCGLANVGPDGVIDGVAYGQHGRYTSLTAEQAAAVDVPALRRFLESPLAEEMRQAETAAREYRFTVLMPARDYDPAAAEEDSILLQGVVDCWFETPEGITVVDFKTDFVQTEEDVAQHAELYRGQLAAYSLALERVLEKAVTRKALYFLQAGKTVEIS